MLGLGGKIYVPLATYSFKISFCIVPLRFSILIPFFSATAMYIAKRIGAVELIVIEVLILSRGIPLNKVSMSF